MAQTKILGGQIDQSTLTGLAPITHASQHYPAGADPVNAVPWHGVVSRTTVSPLPTNLTTTTFTLATGTTPMTYYNNGVKYIVNTNQTCTMQVTGINFIYFDTSNVLTCSSTFPGLAPDTGNVIIAMVFWNGSNFGAVYDERHGYTRDSAWHIWAHNTVGARYGAGLTFSYTGTTNANTTFAISSGNIYDEDINFTIPNTTTARIFRRTSASVFSLITPASTLPYLYNAGTQAVRSDTYALTTITAANRWFNVWIYGSPDVSVAVSAIVETVAPADAGGYTSAANARLIAPQTLPSPSGLSPELKLLYRIVVNGQGLIATPTVSDDYRLSQPLPSGGTATSTASSVTYSPTAPDGSLNVQAALDARYVVTPGTSGNLLTSDGTVWTSAAPATAVTAVSVATANGISGTSSGGTTPALTLALGNITPADVSMTGNLTMVSGKQFLGEFSTGTLTNRNYFQSTTVNGATNINIVPNGTSTDAAIAVDNSSSLGNDYRTSLYVSATEAGLSGNKRGTGTLLPFNIYNAGVLAVGIDTSGNVDAPVNLSTAGNLTLTGTSKVISGDLSNATASNRVYVQTSTTNGNTFLGIKPNGTATTSGLSVENNSTTGNNAIGVLAVSASSVSVQSTIRGSGTLLPMNLLMGSTTALQVTTAGNITISGTLNGNTITTGTGTLTLGAGKTLTVSNTIELAGTDSTTMTFPPGSASIGYLNVPQNSQSAAYTTVAADAGKHLFHPVGDANTRTFTIDSNANVAYALGTTLTFINRSASAVTIAITSDTLTWCPTGGTGSRTLAQYGVATATKITTTEWIITGVGLT